MDFEFEKKWRDLLVEVSKEMDEPLDMQSLIFMIGVQELNQGYVKLSKNQKLDVMHIAICVLLEPYGYYSYTGHDDDGWPHFSLEKELPVLQPIEQETFMKKVIIEYFEKEQ
ncbi:MAG: hypothetical protein QMC21_03200 [Flavobacteriales bacterium]|jgi:hypothetical protein|tara:strand:- start:1672 stop:2007 length:336 start_codon:yes stop_codon:yes gene_type:complete